MKTTNKLPLGLAICSLGLTASATAASLLVGTEIRQATSWDGGTIPDAGDDGFISVDGTVGANFNGGGVTRFVNTTITQSAGTITGIFNTAGASGMIWNLTGGTIDSSAGNFNANSGAIFNLSGGELIFGGDLIVNNIAGGINVSGDAIISTATDFDLRLNQDNAFLEIATDWTGSFVSGSDTTEAQWIDQLVFGAGPAGTGTSGVVNSARQITVGGTAIDDTNFADFFQVTANGGGSTLTLVPEPSSTALLGLGGLALIIRRRK